MVKPETMAVFKSPTNLERARFARENSAVEITSFEGHSNGVAASLAQRCRGNLDDPESESNLGHFAHAVVQIGTTVQPILSAKRCIIRAGTLIELLSMTVFVFTGSRSGHWSV